LFIDRIAQPSSRPSARNTAAARPVHQSADLFPMMTDKELADRADFAEVRTRSHLLVGRVYG
jgi:hypothetical protein